MKRIPVTQASYRKIKGESPSPKGVPGASIKVGKPDKSKEKQASYLGWGGFGGFGRPTMIGASSTFYNNTYMNGGRSGGMGDVPPYIALMNEMNGGVLYYPTTLKEKYEFYRYFCYYVDNQQDKCNILLPDGTTKSIVDLNVGDEIVDGFGKKAIVREKIERTCDDDFAYRFKVATIQDEFKVTREHPFYVLRRSKLFKNKRDTHARKDIDFSPEWITADQIDEGDYFVCPLRTVGNDSSLTVDQATLLGCYAAKGILLYGLRCRTTGYDGGGHGHGDERMKVPAGILFVISADEEFTYGRRFCDAVMKSFGVRARVASRGENSVVFVANGREIADFCHDNCGKFGSEKKLSELVMNASDEAKLAFLTAYAEGDGRYSVKGNNAGKITIGTNSVNLANQVRTIAFSLGMCCRVVRFHRVPNSGFNGLKPKDGYQIVISANSTDAIVENSVKWSSVKVSKKARQRGLLIHDGYALFCIKRIELSNGHGIVYNIGVDNDDYDKQCYIANGVVSHNCRSDPYVKAAVELNTDLPLSRLLLRMPKMEDKKRAKKIQRFYENMVDELHLYDKIHSILFEYNVIGNCYLFVQYSEEKKRWDKLTILPPEEVNVANYPLSDIKQIQYRPEQLISTVMKYNLNVESYEKYLESVEQLSEEDQAVLQDVSYEFVKQIKEHNGVLKFDTDPYHGDGDDKIGSFVFHFAHKRHEYQDLGVSPLECVMTSLLQKTHYMFTQLSLASRNMTPRNLIVADKITAEALDDLRDQVDQSMLSPDYSIVTNYQVQWEQIGADNRLIDLQRENEVIENQLFAGLGVTRELLTGEGMYSGNKISIEILNTKYLLVREMLQRFVEESLFRPVALQNGFYEDDEDGNRTWFYPRLGFTRLTIRDNQEVFDQLFQLYQKGSLPIGMILDIFNINSDDVDEELRKDLFTVKDATYNEMLRQAYSSMGDKLIENTDLVKQVAESIVGPAGKKLKYTGEDADDGGEGGDESFGLGGDEDTGGEEEGGFSLDNLGEEGGEEPASDGDDGFSLDDAVGKGKEKPAEESDSGEGSESTNDKVRDYIDSFRNEGEEDGADSGAREYLDNIVGDSSDENAEKYIDSFLGNSGGRERESSEDEQDAVLVDDEACQESSSSGNDVADFLTGN